MGNENEASVSSTDFVTPQKLSVFLGDSANTIHGQFFSVWGNPSNMYLPFSDLFFGVGWGTPGSL